jgi:hypothetical protein
VAAGLQRGRHGEQRLQAAPGGQQGEQHAHRAPQFGNNVTDMKILTLA